MKNKSPMFTLSKKQALVQALNFAEIPFYGNGEKVKSARALFMIEWLNDMNWHTEAELLEDKATATKHMKDAFIKLQEDENAIRKIDDAVSLLNHIYGWGLARDEWQATQGEALVDELWEMIFKSSDSEPESDETVDEPCDLDADAMDTATKASLQKVIDYLYSDEEKHWMESGSPTDEHIFHDIKKVTEWLKKSL